MLQLKNIWKSYEVADFIQIALSDISIAFRENEFVAILGPSGSGKTTMLNIVGGLDQYETGDLKIEGISTEKFKDRNWDNYRNSRVGFVFQSYNLIPHQTVLANVELALILRGISTTERRARAKLALVEVGLRDHFNKKPNQLSGGQMQRVAIARALINNPEILLADEPTGALDTTTSTQIMNLLSKIARDRLVIMVTHNSELADLYATRIVNLKDGNIISDTHPFPINDSITRTAHKTNRSSMSFITAISLSFNNLMTKKKRTLITSLAGSIGIIGIATIIALANGINAYIRSLEEGALSLYPVTIETISFDLEGLIENDILDENENFGLVQENPILENIFALRRDNDLAALKRYLEDNRQTIDPFVNTIHYIYDITPQIFLADTTAGVQQVNPYPFLDLFNMDDMMALGGGQGMNVFHEMPSNTQMFEQDYELLTGHWPTRYDEAILILDINGRLSDAELFAMGLRDPPLIEEMLDRTNQIAANPELNEELEFFSYDTLMAVEFSVVNSYAMYQYDDTFNVWVTQSEDDITMNYLIWEGIPLRIVGIARPGSEDMAMTLTSGINYTSALTDHLMTEAANSYIVSQQLANPEVNVLTGRTFAEEADDNTAVFDFARLIEPDEEALQEAFVFDMPDFEIDINDLDLGDINLDLGALDLTGVNNPAPPLDLGDIAPQLGISADALTWIVVGVMNQFFWETMQTGITNPDDLVSALTTYFARPDVQDTINSQLTTVIGNSELQGQINEILQTQIQLIVQTNMEQLVGILNAEIQTQVQQLMETMAVNIATQVEMQVEEAMARVGEQFEGIDPAIITDAFQVEMDEDEVFSLMTALMNPAEVTYDRNLNLLGFANYEIPHQINIYPQNFEAKQEIIDILDSYNERMEDQNQPERVVHYTDAVGDTMSAVTDIVNMVSYALITFVAISLIVSSIMIGVITYISVLERKKEIGILRAIGASKRNIRRVFNAETLIVGFISGVLGVLITLGITEISNVVVYNQFGIERITRLPILAMLILVITSMFLTFIAGLFPSSAAARKDPIEALRSD